MPLDNAQEVSVVLEKKYRLPSGLSGLKVIAKNTGWLFFDKILRLGLGLLVSIFVARSFGPEQFGLLGFATALVFFFERVATLGLQGVVVRNIVCDSSNNSKIMGSTIILLVCGSVFAYGLLVASIYCLRPSEGLTHAVVALVGLRVLCRISDAVIYWFEACVRSKYTVLVECCVFLFFSVLKIILLLSGISLIHFCVIIFCESALCSVALFCVFCRFGIRCGGLQYSFEVIRSLLSDSWPLFLSGLTVVFYMRIDQVMLGQMLGNSFVGVYSIASKISEPLYFIPTTISVSVFPALLRLKQTDEDEYLKNIQALFDFLVVFAIALALPMTLLSSRMVVFLFGESYAQAGPVLVFHLWAAIFGFLGVASHNWILAENKPMLALQRTLLGAVINCILNFTLIPKFGVLGAAFSTLVSQIWTSLLFDLFKKDTRIMFFMKIRSLNIASTLRGGRALFRSY